RAPAEPAPGALLLFKRGRERSRGRRDSAARPAERPGGAPAAAYGGIGPAEPAGRRAAPDGGRADHGAHDRRAAQLPERALAVGAARGVPAGHRRALSRDGRERPGGPARRLRAVLRVRRARRHLLQYAPAPIRGRLVVTLARARDRQRADSALGGGAS